MTVLDRLATAALAALLMQGCQPAEHARAVVQTSGSQQDALLLGEGDKVIGIYQNCAGHLDGEAWQAVIADPEESTVEVVMNNRDCQLWLTQLQRGGSELFTLYSPESPGIETPILLQQSYARGQAALAMGTTSGVKGTLVNAVGSGLDFSGATFTIQIKTGTTGDLGSLTVTIQPSQ